MTKYWVLVVIVATFVGVAAATADQAIEKPRLTVESTDGRTKLFVESRDAGGVSVLHLLRETDGPVRALQSGWDLAGVAGFASWTEQGFEHWTAYTRDGGGSWS